MGAWQSSLGNQSHYLDLGYLPLFPFGFGLSYGDVEYGNIKSSGTTLVGNNSITFSIDIYNKSDRLTTETIQLYAHDKVGRLTRPVRELKRFKKVKINKGERQTIQFKLQFEDFMYYDNEGKFEVEVGEIDIYMGKDSHATEKITIEIGD